MNIINNADIFLRRNDGWDCLVKVLNLHTSNLDIVRSGVKTIFRLSNNSQIMRVEYNYLNIHKTEYYSIRC